MNQILNEFSAKKLGEVLAFSRIGVETWGLGKAALTSVFGDQAHVDAIIADLQAQCSQIETLVLDPITLQKADATSDKLRNMRDLYIGDAWDNPAELLEWFGFFEGAAIVHWSLVLGAAQSLNLVNLIDLAEDGIGFHRSLLKASEEKLRQIGSQKAKQ